MNFDCSNGKRDIFSPVGNPGESDVWCGALLQGKLLLYQMEYTMAFFWPLFSELPTGNAGLNGPSLVCMTDNHSVRCPQVDKTGHRGKTCWK